MTSTNPGPPESNDGRGTSSQSDELSNTQPPKTSATTQDVPSFGWSGYAERVNGRFAMIGFVAILLIEALSNDSFIHWIGLLP